MADTVVVVYNVPWVHPDTHTDTQTGPILYPRLLTREGKMMWNYRSWSRNNDMKCCDPLPRQTPADPGWTGLLAHCATKSYLCSVKIYWLNTLISHLTMEINLTGNANEHQGIEITMHNNIREEE